jgi:hypothetical protein
MHYGRSVSRGGHDQVRRHSSSTAVASFVRAVESRVGDQPQDNCDFAQARDDRGHEDWARRAKFGNCD